MSVEFITNRLVPNRSNNTVSTEVGNGIIKTTLLTATVATSNECTVLWWVHDDDVLAFIINLNANYNTIFSLVTSGQDPFQTGFDTNDVKLLGGVTMKRIKEYIWEIQVRYRLQ